MGSPNDLKMWLCHKCEKEMFFCDEWRFRRCDPVERINEIAEEKSEPIHFYHGLHLDHIAPLLASRMAYIECADIIMEAE